MRKAALAAVLGAILSGLVLASLAAAHGDDRGRGKGDRIRINDKVRVVIRDNGRMAKAFLDGYQETPSISTRGSGTFHATLESGRITFRLTYQDLEGGTPSAAHLHLSERHVAGGVVAFLCGGGGKPACPASGTVEGTIVPTDVVALTAQGIAAGEFNEVVAAIRAGAVYANVHTPTYPNGEIRGQLDAKHFLFEDEHDDDDD